MKIEQIEIVNFRSIQELVILPKKLNAIIGKNSSGKTNILKAIDLVLGEGWTTKAKIARELFNDVSKEIFIKIDFEKTLETTWFKGRVLNVKSVTLRMNYDPLECQVKLWENYPHDFNGQGYGITEDFKNRYQFIYIPSDRNLTNELRVSNWTLLGKMMKLIYDNYVVYKGSEEALKAEFTDLMKPPKEFLEYDFREESGGISFKTFHDTFQKHCIMNSSGLAEGFTPSLNVYNINWFYKTLQIAVKEQGFETLFDAEQLGSGVQNLVMLAIFQTYAELLGGNIIFGFEEPEIYLYPHAQRNLYNNFIDISNNSQIFYTTHNPNFIDAFRAYEIIRVYKDIEFGTQMFDKNEAIVNPEVFESHKYKIYTHFNTERNEMFFADFVILVEGVSDKILWQTLIEKKWGYDTNKLGISIIDCGGKGGVIYFIGVCRLMGLTNFTAIWDRDKGKDKDAQNHLGYCLENGIGLEIDPNLETFLTAKFEGYSFNDEDNKIEVAADWAIGVDEKNIPEEFDFIRERLKNVFKK